MNTEEIWRGHEAVNVGCFVGSQGWLKFCCSRIAFTADMPASCLANEVSTYNRPGTVVLKTHIVAISPS